jgi:glycine betaine/proline transport system substrate-binding protein
MVGALAGALALAACGGDAGDAGDVGSTPTGEEAAEGDVGQGRTVTIGWIPWEEDIAVTNLWQVILEENGFEVEQQQLDAGLLFDGLASGDLDLFLDAWLPNTHADYWQEYGPQLSDLGAWLEEAPLTWTVPAYVDEVDSIADLDEHAELFDGRIVGIESSAGLTRISREEVIPAYGLGDSFELLESSTPAMLAELENAVSNEEPIVVTLWRPHPAYARYDLEDLEDPKGALGEPDEIHALAREGFEGDYPEVAAALDNFQFDSDVLSNLEVAVLEEEGAELEGARQWLEDNRDYVAEWLEGTGLSI